MFLSGLKIRLLFISGLLLIYSLRLCSAANRWREVPDQAQVKLIGHISQQPYLKDSKQYINIEQFFIVTDRFPEYFYGQKVEVVGKLHKRVINRFKTNFTLNYPTICLAEEQASLINQSKIIGFLLSLRNRMEESFSCFLSEPQASLLAGILLGVKKEMPEKFLKDLQETGTIHVVVASGYNITVIAGFLISSLAGRLNRKIALLLSFLGILAYTLMAGAEPPIVRAAIMAGLTYLAQFLGREKDALLSLAIAGIVMLLISPLILFDIGFQLSFAATAGILLLSPFLVNRIFNPPVLGEELRITLAAQIATLPILLVNFGRLSWLSPLINALVLPTIPLIMVLGTLTILGGQIFAWLAWVPLTYFVKIIELFASLPWISFCVPKISFWWAAGYYGVLGVWIWRKNKILNSKLQCCK